ncbi:sigma factor [Bacillus phage CM1]|nr:sigma factor [Bacillus phage CM1]
MAITNKQKEEAIRLLEGTSKPLREIAKLTGISQSKVWVLSKEHRPKEVSQNNMRKGQLHSLLAQGKITQETFNEEMARVESKVKDVVLPSAKDFSEEPVTGGSVVVGYDHETNVKGRPFNFNFSINAEETNVSKGVAVMRLKEAMELLDSLPVEEVSLNVTIK